MSLNWFQSKNQESKNYTCGHCGKQLVSNIGYQKSTQEDGGGRASAFIYICHFCRKPTYFEGGEQSPGARHGEDVLGINDAGVEALYKEARDSFSKNAYTSAVLCCRKLLMHIAVAKGDAAGKSFIEYVEFLSEKNYVPPDAKGWVDHIRQKGNEANHEIVVMSKEEASDLLSFSEMLLKLVYEFPNKIKAKNNT